MEIQPPKLSKFGILAINLPLRGDSFALFLRNSQRLYASIGSFYVFGLVAFRGTYNKVISIFPRWRHFPHKFSIAPSGETTDRIKKKLGGAKMARTSSITTRSIYNGGDRGWRAGCRRKSVMFFVTCAKRSRISIAFTQWSKNGFFRPAGETHYLDKGEIWHGKAVRSPVPNFTFMGAEMWKYSRGDSFTKFLRNFEHLHASLSGF